MDLDSIIEVIKSMSILFGILIGSSFLLFDIVKIAELKRQISEAKAYDTIKEEEELEIEMKKKKDKREEEMHKHKLKLEEELSKQKFQYEKEKHNIEMANLKQQNNTTNNFQSKFNNTRGLK